MEEDRANGKFTDEEYSQLQRRKGVCTACGKAGHKSTNRECVFYEQTMRERAQERRRPHATPPRDRGRPHAIPPT
eukprot:5475333-Prymnesium_polylepis.1